ncbi:MAG: hypothetical protein ACRD96_16000, partial [Bryobacteraceae bacterium]
MLCKRQTLLFLSFVGSPAFCRLTSHLRRIYSDRYIAQPQSLAERGFVWLYATIARLVADQYQSGTSEGAESPRHIKSPFEIGLVERERSEGNQSRWY